MSPISIVYFGATGYLGSSILAKLLELPNKDSFEITALVRSEEKAKKLEKFGIKTVVGSYTDLPLVEDLSSKGDYIFSVADSDALESIKAVLAGAKKRHAATGKAPALIHTSGTGIYIWSGLTGGNQIVEKIWNDDEPEVTDREVPDSALHRDVDLEILKADDAGYVNGYVVLPSTIWGVGDNVFVKEGIANFRSIQIPALMNASVSRGAAGQVGQGLGAWNGVNVNEQADFYAILFSALQNKPETVPHGHKGYFIGEAGEYTWAELAQAIGKAMVKLGLATSAEPTTFKEEELPQYFGSAAFGSFFGSTARGRGNNSRKLGWNPQLTTRDMLNDIEAQLAAFVKK